MRRTVLASVGCLLVCAFSPAFAADMPMPMKGAPYYAPYYNWTGFYIGVNGGYGFGSSNWTRGAATTGGFDIDGALVGGTVGFNIQTGAFVWGVEGDYDWADIRGSRTVAVCAGAGACKTSSNGLATARGRVGYAFDRWLPYVTGGAAFGDVKATSALGSSSSTEVGWTVGAGLEWAFLANWTAKVEYLYADLGKGSCTSACNPPGPVDVKFQTSIARAGLNYRF